MKRFSLGNENFNTINPYRTGFQIILFRLIWDLNPLSWVSRKRLMAYRNKHKGQKAIILCNGPSLNKVDLNGVMDSGIFTFGLNKINLIFKRTYFRPSVIVSVNPYVIKQNIGFLNKTTIPLLINSRSHRWIKNKKTIFLHCSKAHGLFAKDCSISINEGFTVTYVAMQLAFYMGFKKIALVGCDHSFASKGIPNKAVVAEKEDQDHFDPAYFSNGAIWQLPDLNASEFHYNIAREIFNLHGRIIFNCTEGGRLELFQRQPLKDFLL